MAEQANMTTVQDVMTTDLFTLPETATIGKAAQGMRDRHIGTVLVTNTEGMLVGILTDRDLVVDGLAEDHDATTEIGALLTGGELAVVGPGEELAGVVAEMKREAVKRLPVVDGGRPVGIVSLGDLAVDHDVDAIVRELAAAPPNA